MPEPATTTAIVSTVASTINSSLNIARFISDIKNTPTDVKTCFDLTRRIEEDLSTLINLRSRHEKYLLTVPDTLKRIDRIIHGTREGILDVCRLLEGCREEVYEGHMIPLGRKMKWVLGDSVAFSRRTTNLQQQHAAVNVEILSLRQMDMLKPLERIATTTFENLELLGMERKKATGGTPRTKESRLDKDVGQPSPFALGISPTASLSALPSVDRDYRFPSNNLRPSPSIPTPSIPVVSESEVESIEVEENGDDDAESAFYKDLRRQEEERRRRLAARRRMG